MNTKQIIQNMEKDFDAHYGEYGDDDFRSCSPECELNIDNIKKFIHSYTCSLLEAFAEEVIGTVPKYGDEVEIEQFKELQRLKAKEIIESIDDKCPNCGNGKDIDRWATTSQTQMYWKGKPNKSPIISRSVCPVCGKAKEIIKSLEK